MPRKIIEFDDETFQALHLLARDGERDLQELADEAFRDLLIKHGRPVTLKEMLSASSSAKDASPPPARSTRRKPARTRDGDA